MYPGYTYFVEHAGVFCFFMFFSNFAFLSENTHYIYVWANSYILLYPFLSVFCPVNRTVNRYGLTERQKAKRKLEEAKLAK